MGSVRGTEDRRTEVFTVDGSRYTVVPSGHEGARIVVFEDAAYNLEAEYLTSERYEWLREMSKGF